MGGSNFDDVGVLPSFLQVSQAEISQLLEGLETQFCTDMAPS